MKPSSVYSVTIPLNASGLLIAHHQEVNMYICDNWYVFYVLVDCRRALMVDSVQARRQSTKTYNTYQLSHIYIFTT
jgi:aminoglycoside phosphotransferase (APT) family kinase protein